MISCRCVIGGHPKSMSPIDRSLATGTLLQVTLQGNTPYYMPLQKNYMPPMETLQVTKRYYMLLYDTTATGRYRPQQHHSTLYDTTLYISLQYTGDYTTIKVVLHIATGDNTTLQTTGHYR